VRAQAEEKVAVARDGRLQREAPRVTSAKGRRPR
jgi:hypothetical protein